MSKEITGRGAESHLMCRKFLYRYIGQEYGKEKKLKLKKGKFKDTFSEDMKGQNAGNVQEVNSFAILRQKIIH
jgi:hypothetical protein